MVKSKVVEAIGFFGRCLKEKGVIVSRTILFGSQIRGKVTNESDVDIMIISDDLQGKNIFKT